MRDNKYDYLIVGSGAGGATLAKELAQRKKKVLVAEAGKIEKTIGTIRDMLRYWDMNRIIPLPRKSKEGVMIHRTIMAGGSTVVSTGNGVRSLEKELGDFGIDLSKEFIQAEQEMHIAPIEERLLSAGSKAIMQAGKEIGYDIELMPKFFNPKMCRKCGMCVLGCAKGAKWTALDFLQDANKSGADTIYGTKVKEVIISNGKAKGIRCVDKEGIKEIFADAVILAAGGIGTPIILQNSGIKDAGSGLFVDLHVKAYAVTDNDKLNQMFEPAMTLKLDLRKTKGLCLSPMVSHLRMLRFIEFGLRGFILSDKRTLGINIGTSDDPVGHVYPDGSISKPVTEKDWQRLREGSSIAKEILIKAGARSVMVSSKPQGAHPGGTAAIGKVVDNNFQTKVDGLFVCDASVLPMAPGAPPILTIVALAKRLANTLP